MTWDVVLNLLHFKKAIIKEENWNISKHLFKKKCEYSYELQGAWRIIQLLV